MNILLPPAIYLALALLLAIVVGRRLRATASRYIEDEFAVGIDAPYTVPVEPMTPAERERVWVGIAAELRCKCPCECCSERHARPSERLLETIGGNEP